MHSNVTTPNQIETGTNSYPASSSVAPVIEIGGARFEYDSACEAWEINFTQEDDASPHTIVVFAEEMDGFVKSVAAFGALLPKLQIHQQAKAERESSDMQEVME